MIKVSLVSISFITCTTHNLIQICRKRQGSSALQLSSGIKEDKAPSESHGKRIVRGNCSWEKRGINFDLQSSQPFLSCV